MQRGVSQKESLHEGMQLVFNFPIKDDELQQYLLVTDTQSNEKVSVNVVQDITSGTYIIQPKS
ncbi:MAG: hypothetical protein WCJ45_01040 [bacterium]